MRYGPRAARSARRAGHVLSQRYMLSAVGNGKTMLPAGVRAEVDELLGLLRSEVDVQASLDEVDEHGWCSILVVRLVDVRVANAFVAGWNKGRVRGL